MKIHLSIINLMIIIIGLSGCVTTEIKGSSSNLSTIAAQYTGMHEHKHRKKLTNILGVDPVRIPWCGAFGKTVAKKAGHQPPKNYLMARSWATFGKKTSSKNLRKGDVIVMNNHVTFFTKKTKNSICGIGGNQSNKIQESCFSSSSVIAYRTP